MNSSSAVSEGRNPLTQRADTVDPAPRLLALAECAALLALLRGIEIYLLGQGYFATLTLHPFWIIVLLAPLQYGVFVGLATAAVASALIDWPQRELGVDLVTHYLAAGALPLQWVVAAVFIGLVREAQLEDARRVVGDNNRLGEVNDALASEVNRLNATIAQLEYSGFTGGYGGGAPEDEREDQAAKALIALRGATRETLLSCFRAAAQSWLELPVRLLLSEDGKTFEPLPNDRPLPSLPLPYEPPETVGVTGPCRSASAVVHHHANGKRTATFVLARGASSPGRKAGPMVLVVAQASNDAAARAAAPATEILADAAARALARGAGEPRGR